MNAANISRRRAALTFPLNPVVAVALGFFLAIAAVMLIAIEDTWAAYAAVLVWTLIATVPLGLFVERQLRLGDPRSEHHASEDPVTAEDDLEFEGDPKMTAFHRGVTAGIEEAFQGSLDAVTHQRQAAFLSVIDQYLSHVDVSGLDFSQHYRILNQPSLFDESHLPLDVDEDVREEVIALLSHANDVHALAVEPLELPHGDDRVLLVLSIPSRFPTIPPAMRFGGTPGAWQVKRSAQPGAVRTFKIGRAYGGQFGQNIPSRIFKGTKSTD